MSDGQSSMLVVIVVMGMLLVFWASLTFWLWRRLLKQQAAMQQQAQFVQDFETFLAQTSDFIYFKD